MNTLARRIHPELPIFCLDSEEHSFIYVPGSSRRVDRAEAQMLQDWFASRGTSSMQAVPQLAAMLETQARRSMAEWRRLSEKPYAPVCLTVYLSNRCNLQCSYCFSAANRGTETRDRPALAKRDAGFTAIGVVDVAAVERAADVVAENCSKDGKPLTVVLHGGGEPTLHWQLVRRLVSATREVAAEHGIDWWGYIATNGVVSEAKAEWLARHFNLIGLSCDGPPAIHDIQRPTVWGHSTSAIVARTGRAFIRNGTPFVVRTTITPDTIGSQSEIVQYIAETFGARTLRFEPAYGVAGVRGSWFLAADAERFVREFLCAKDVASRLSCDLQISGARTLEVHGPHCNVLRDVLQITPDGVASACFAVVSGATAEARGVSLGRIDVASAQVGIDVERAREMRIRATQIPAKCQDCVNVYHCVRQCPEHCALLEHKDGPNEPEGFSCLVSRQLAEDWICRYAAS